MGRVLGLVIVSKECVIEPELEYDGYQGQRNRQQRQHPELASREIASVNGHQHESESAVHNTADPEDQRVFNCLCDLVVYRGCYSRPRLMTAGISAARVKAAAARLMYSERKNVAGINANSTIW